MFIVELGQLFFKALDNCTARIAVNIKMNWRFSKAGRSKSVICLRQLHGEHDALLCKSKLGFKFLSHLVIEKFTDGSRKIFRLLANSIQQ